MVYITHEDNLFYKFIDSNIINLVKEGSNKIKDKKLHYVVIPYLKKHPKLYNKFKEYINHTFDIDCLDDFPKDYSRERFIKDKESNNLLYQVIKVDTKNVDIEKITTYTVYYM